MLYLIDANVLIRAHEDYYALDRVPQFWEWLEQQALADRIKRLCCKSDEGVLVVWERSGSSYDCTPARRSCTNATATLNAHGPMPKARSTSLASPTMPPSKEGSPA